MNADDDGFCEHFSVMRMIDAKPDDLKILHAKGFVKVFDDRVLVIIDWKENNYLRSDRYTPSKYLAIYKEELKSLVSGIPNGNQRDTQDRIGKDRLGKDKEDSNGQAAADIVKVLNAFEAINPAIKRMYGNKTQRDSADRLIKRFGIEKVLLGVNTAIKVIEDGIKYVPKITTPYQLETEWAKLWGFANEYKNNKREVIL